MWNVFPADKAPEPIDFSSAEVSGEKAVFTGILVAELAAPPTPCFGGQATPTSRFSGQASLSSGRRQGAGHRGSKKVWRECDFLRFIQ